MMSPNNRTIYFGITNDLIRRVFEHKNKLIQSFAQKYNVTKLVYYETTNDVNAAIAREKQIKGGSRQKKLDLIASTNPKFDDLYEKLL